MATNKRKLGTTRKSEEKGLQPSRKAKATAAVTTAASKKRKAEEEAAARDKKDGDKGDAVAPAPHVGGGKRKRKSAVEAPAIKAPAVEAPAVEAPTAAAHAHEPATGKRATAAKRRRLAKEFHVALAAGDVFTFGSNPFGALGLGEDITEKQRAAHVDLGGAKAVQVACGGMHTAVLLEDGSVITFGVNDEGALGRPTSGSAWDDATADEKEDAAVPGRARLPEDVHVIMLAAGDGFTLALSEQGEVWGWGSFKDDASGKQGFAGCAPGTKLARLPQRVYRPPSVRDRVRRVVAGARHAALLTRKGDVLTLGMGAQGQLGRVRPYDNSSYPPLDVLLSPAPVSELAAVPGGSDVVDIAAGAYCTFALTNRGSVLGWGLNNASQLALADQQLVWEPAVLIAGALRSGITVVAGGEHHTLALTRRGVVLAWGKGTYGTLGREAVDVGSDTVQEEPMPVDVVDGLGEETPTMLVAGTNVSGAVTREGNAFLWGSNVNGQMAKGNDEDDNNQPTRMRRHKAFGNRKILQISFGGQHGALLASTPQESPAPAVQPATTPSAVPGGTTDGVASTAEQHDAITATTRADNAPAAEANGKVPAVAGNGTAT